MPRRWIADFRMRARRRQLRVALAQAVFGYPEEGEAPQVVVRTGEMYGHFERFGIALCVAQNARAALGPVGQANFNGPISWVRDMVDMFSWGAHGERFHDRTQGGAARIYLGLTT